MIHFNDVTGRRWRDKGVGRNDQSIDLRKDYGCLRTGREAYVGVSTVCRSLGLSSRDLLRHLKVAGRFVINLISGGLQTQAFP